MKTLSQPLEKALAYYEIPFSHSPEDERIYEIAMTGNDGWVAMCLDDSILLVWKVALPRDSERYWDYLQLTNSLQPRLHHIQSIC